MIVLLKSLKSGERAPANPWGAATWSGTPTSPPIHHNFTTRRRSTTRIASTTSSSTRRPATYARTDEPVATVGGGR